MIVEDDFEILELITEQLTSNFYIRMASDGKEALAIINDDQIDLILSDIDMPTMCGISLLKEIRSSSCPIPFVFMSSSTDYTRDELLRLGANEFYYKPAIEFQNLVNKIQSLISK